MMGDGVSGILASGQLIAGHRIDSVISQSATSVVYRARDLRLNREVALEVFRGGVGQSGTFR